MEPMIDQPEIFAMLEDDTPLEMRYEQRGEVRYYCDLMQGTNEWAAARCGMLTASEMHLIVTPTLKAASNEKERTHLYELLAQRVTGYVEPTYIGDDMLRGWSDEDDVRRLYAKHFARVEQVGFVTCDRWGFTLGYSPDGLVGDDGLIEIKSRRQKFQVQTIIEGQVPPEFMIQIQTGLLVTGRAWCDFVSYCGGLPFSPIRVLPDEKMQEAILAAATAFEQRMAEKLAAYRKTVADGRHIPTIRHENDIRV
jgi:hypothetical protein